ncbi:MAG: hypothetical protein IPK54_09995 [Dokdonella sp.]|uniref:pseudouridine synthase n=1 Tax=Dokdonella sp. TaxID=2291710 RepID=UPI0025BD86CE|nr:pseudouridine synthase [Dokdonella sp.]MBK8123864.1 hypothetical protein [Dokdonella sp.]
MAGRGTDMPQLMHRYREQVANGELEVRIASADLRTLADNSQRNARGTLDYPLPGVRENSERKAAITHWRRLQTTEVSVAVNRYPQQRYSLVEITPETGRYRQIRRHFAHLRHPLIGDTSHGHTEHNRLFKAVLRFTPPAAARAQPELRSSG